jgi:hypothetical protein
LAAEREMAGPAWPLAGYSPPCCVGICSSRWGRPQDEALGGAGEAVASGATGEGTVPGSGVAMAQATSQTSWASAAGLV